MARVLGLFLESIAEETGTRYSSYKESSGKNGWMSILTSSHRVKEGAEGWRLNSVWTLDALPAKGLLTQFACLIYFRCLLWGKVNHILLHRSSLQKNCSGIAPMKTFKKSNVSHCRYLHSFGCSFDNRYINKPQYQNHSLFCLISKRETHVLQTQRVWTHVAKKHLILRYAAKCFVWQNWKRK